MSNWKKIIVSGSQAHLSSVTASNGSIISGSLTISGSINNPDNLDFNTTPPQSVSSTVEGRLSWDNGTRDLIIGAGNNVDIHVGQQEWAYVYNAEATTLTKGEIVYISGSQGNTIAVKRASDINDPNSAGTLGMVGESITSGAEGLVLVNGLMRKLDTSTLTAGSLLYLSSTPGAYTQTIPTSPSHSVRIGYVAKVDATQGEIYVKVDNGYEIGELHDIIDGTTTTSYGDLLVKSGSVWKNSKQLTGSYGITGSMSITGSLIINGTSYTAASSGTSGTSGTSGANGSSGTSGNSGSSGTSGTSGANGSSGTSGNSGSSGTSGTSGANGSSGTSGANGSSGTSGNSGSSGTSGTRGTSGTSGTSGANGSSGTSGNSGSSGTSGANGSSGTSGTGFTTISNASDNRILTSDGSVNSAVAETNLTFDGSTFTVTGNAVITGRLTAEEYHTEFVSASILFQSGSTKLGNTIDDRHQITGSVDITGSLQIPRYSTNPTAVLGGIYYNTGDSNVYRSNGSTWLSAAGSSGTSGTSGANGSSGTSGTSGANGSSGTSGNSGSSGTSGNSGSSGTSGANGSSGTSGTSGANGSSGTSGNSGSSGTSGVNGSSGTSGANGSSGTSGNSGSSGTSGVNGSSGTSGNSGSSGTSGANGSSGTSGTSGSDGASGSSGTSGNSGSSGTSGSSGISGSSGTSGANGGSGTSGTSGNSGSSGTSGANGSSGTSGTGFSTITNASNDRILTSDGSSNSAVAETNLTFNGSLLSVISNVSASQYTGSLQYFDFNYNTNTVNGIGIGNATGNSNHGVGVGFNANNNDTFGVGIGAYATSNSQGVGSVAIGSYSKVERKNEIISTASTSTTNKAQSIIQKFKEVSLASAGNILHEIFTNGVNSRVTIQPSSLYHFRIQINAIEAVNFNCKTWEVVGAIKRDASNNTTMVAGSPTYVVTSADAGLFWNVVVDADDVNDALRIRIQHTADNDVTVSATIWATETRL